MIDPIFSFITGLIANYGFPILLVIFFLKGVFVAKPISSTIVISAYVATVSPSFTAGVLIGIVCSMASVSGEVFIFQTIRRNGYNSLDDVSVRIPQKVQDKTKKLFDDYGIFAVLFGSMVPGIRGTINVTAALNGYPQLWTAIASLFGTSVYYVSVTLAALGVIQVIF